MMSYYASMISMATVVYL